mmetsp:Transcript_115369/g.366908  ORF Transcript_115369/g.366908 Transcript_115369/m.366908 type:complete len:244 (+) Transcript_115369:426-1157(+)
MADGSLFGLSKNLSRSPWASCTERLGLRKVSCQPLKASNAIALARLAWPCVTKPSMTAGRSLSWGEAQKMSTLLMRPPFKELLYSGWNQPWLTGTRKRSIIRKQPYSNPQSQPVKSARSPDHSSPTCSKIMYFTRPASSNLDAPSNTSTSWPSVSTLSKKTSSSSPKAQSLCSNRPSTVIEGTVTAISPSSRTSPSLSMWAPILLLPPSAISKKRTPSGLAVEDKAAWTAQKPLSNQPEASAL